MKKFIYFLTFSFFILGINSQTNSKEDFNVLEDKYNKIVNKFPNDINVLEELGDLYAIHGKWNQASKIYKQLLKKNPYNSNYNFKYGGVLGMMAKEGSKIKALGLINQAKKLFKKAEKLDSKNWQVQWAQVELYTQLPDFLGGSYNKAWIHAERLEELSKINGYFAKAYISNQKKNIDAFKNYTKMGLSILSNLECYMPKTEINLFCIPHDNNINYQISNGFKLDNSNLQEATKFLAKYIQNYTPKDRIKLDQAYLDLAKIYIKKNQLDYALKSINNSLKINPNFKSAKLEKKQILIKKRNLN